jgi:adenylate kinase family enzyme
MKRIAIIGSCGAGKSTLARQMGTILGLEVIHLDSFFWKPGWVETPRVEWRSTVENLVKRETWIIDGNYGSTFDIRLEAADTIVFWIS